MDEAHLLKDSSTMRSKRVREMVKNAKSRLMLTGTPLQNDLQVLLFLPALFFLIFFLSFRLIKVFSFKYL